MPLIWLSMWSWLIIISLLCRVSPHTHPPINVFKCRSSPLCFWKHLSCFNTSDGVPLFSVLTTWLFCAWKPTVELTFLCHLFSELSIHHVSRTSHFLHYDYWNFWERATRKVARCQLSSSPPVSFPHFINYPLNHSGCFSRNLELLPPPVLDPQIVQWVVKWLTMR